MVASEKVAVLLAAAPPLPQGREYSMKLAVHRSEELYEYFGCPAFPVWQSTVRTFAFATIAEIAVAAAAAAIAETEVAAAVAVATESRDVVVAA